MSNFIAIFLMSVGAILFSVGFGLKIVDTEKERSKGFRSGYESARKGYEWLENAKVNAQTDAYRLFFNEEVERERRQKESK